MEAQPMAETLVRMPKLADTLVEGTLGEWLKQVGEAVAPGEPLARVETDKVTTELSAPVAGTVLALLVEAGQTVPVETPIARIGAASVADAPSAVPVEPPPAPPAEPAPQPRPTPVAARLLAEHGLAPAEVSPSSGARRVTKADVLRHLAASPTPSAPPVPVAATTAVGLVPLTSMRRAIAEHMTRARQTIPHGQTVAEADLSRLVAWLERSKATFEQREGARLTLSVCFVAALARALAATSYQPVDLGVAVALDGGLIVPLIRDAASLSLGQTARAIADLAERARSGRLQPSEAQGGLMTVTNVGSFQNLLAGPIIPVGQIGILGPGLVEERPLPADGQAVRIGWRCLLSLVVDRRAIDDFAADRLLGAVIDQLNTLPT
jgi:2-oxoglutarate dehydrogenase E2 component (dihydrolipoamide succinyltransferase)